MPRKTDNIKINDIQKTIENLTNRIKELEISIKHDNTLKTKNNKDRKKPKKYISAYLFFYMERLEDFKRKNPNININAADVAKESGKEWNKIKNDHKKIEKYKKMEEEDKKRIEKENILKIQKTLYLYILNKY